MCLRSVTSAILGLTLFLISGCDSSSSIQIDEGSPELTANIPRGVLEEIAKLRAKASSGDDQAALQLGQIYLSPALGAPDVKKAIDFLDMASRRGNASAKLLLGQLYLNGIGINKDTEKAESLFRDAASRDLKEAQYFVAKVVIGRSHTSEELKEAISLLKSSADRGFAPALDLVGDLLRTGTFTAKDPTKAVSYYQAAGKSGFVDSIRKIADMYLFSELGRADIEQAKGWYEKSSAAGDSESFYALALLLYLDSDLSLDDKKDVVELLRNAALLWHEQSQYLLGRVFYEGNLAERDLEEAFFWLDLAASAGINEAHHLRALVEKKLSPEQVENVRARAREWFRENHATPHKHKFISDSEHIYQ